MSRTKVRKPQQERSRALVDAIVQAGILCLAKYGRAGTTTRHVADMAGISVGSLYEYFENKEAIYDAIVQRLLHDVIDMIQPMIPALARMEIREAIRTLLLAFQKLLRRDDSLYLKVVRQSLNVDLKDHISFISQPLQQLIMQHVLNNPEHMRLTHLGPMTYIFINGGIFTIVRHLSEPNPPVSYEELVNGLADMVGHYVEREMQLLAARDQTSR